MYHLNGNIKKKFVTRLLPGPLTPGSKMMTMPMSPQDPVTQLSTFKSYVALIADTTPNSAYRSP